MKYFFIFIFFLSGTQVILFALNPSNSSQILIKLLSALIY